MRSRSILFLPLILAAGFLAACGTDDAQSSASCIEGVTAACVCTNGRSGAQTCGATGAFGACECTGGGDIDAGDVSSPDLCTPGAQAACACPGGQTGVQFCDDNGRFAACACEAAPGMDAGDTSGPSPADGGPILDDGDATNDPDGQDGQDGQGGQNACGGTSDLIYEGAPAAAGDACGCSGTLTCASANELECTGGAEPNACGGCNQLDDEPGAACGSCAAGRWACDGIDALVCDGGRDENLCGGCALLDGRPGDVCDGDDGAGIWACDGTERVLCNGEGRNACGGNGVLDAPPGSLCGSCGLGTWQCDGREDVICQNADRGENECGGCEVLAGAPGSTCECTGTWQCDAPGSDTVTCVGGSANVCGGCDVLTNRPGDRCATGVFYCADQTLLCGSVDPNDCGGVEPLPADPGQPCGACGSGVWSCASNNAVYCEGDIGEDRFNACGGCTRLPAEPDTACGQCDSGTWTCQGTDGLTCAGESPEALFYHWPDFDQDGFGDRDATPVVLCSPVARFVDNPGDCDDTRNYSFPDAEERCDGFDNNCDGFGDELLTRECYSAPIETRDVGICEGGTQRCISGVWSTCAGETTPSEDTCDTLDNDCDGTPDNSTSLLTDVDNCGECGNRCEAFNTTYACVEGGCEIEACDAGWTLRNMGSNPECDCALALRAELDLKRDPSINVIPSRDEGMAPMFTSGGAPIEIESDGRIVSPLVLTGPDGPEVPVWVTRLGRGNYYWHGSDPNRCFVGTADAILATIDDGDCASREVQVMGTSTVIAAPSETETTHLDNLTTGGTLTLPSAATAPMQLAVDGSGGLYVAGPLAPVFFCATSSNCQTVSVGSYTTDLQLLGTNTGSVMVASRNGSEIRVRLLSAGTSLDAHDFNGTISRILPGFGSFFAIDRNGGYNIAVVEVVEGRLTVTYPNSDDIRSDFVAVDPLGAPVKAGAGVYSWGGSWVDRYLFDRDIEPWTLMIGFDHDFATRGYSFSNDALWMWTFPYPRPTRIASMDQLLDTKPRCDSFRYTLGTLTDSAGSLSLVVHRNSSISTLGTITTLPIDFEIDSGTIARCSDTSLDLLVTTPNGTIDQFDLLRLRLEGLDDMPSIASNVNLGPIGSRTLVAASARGDGEYSLLAWRADAAGRIYEHSRWSAAPGGLEWSVFTRTREIEAGVQFEGSETLGFVYQDTSASDSIELALVTTSDSAESMTQSIGSIPALSDLRLISSAVLDGGGIQVIFSARVSVPGITSARYGLFAAVFDSKLQPVGAPSLIDPAYSGIRQEFLGATEAHLGPVHLVRDKYASSGNSQWADGLRLLSCSE